LGVGDVTSVPGGYAIRRAGEGDYSVIPVKPEERVSVVRNIYEGLDRTRGGGAGGVLTENQKYQIRSATDAKRTASSMINQYTGGRIITNPNTGELIHVGAGLTEQDNEALGVVRDAVWAKLSDPKKIDAAEKQLLDSQAEFMNKADALRARNPDALKKLKRGVKADEAAAAYEKAAGLLRDAQAVVDDQRNRLMNSGLMGGELPTTQQPTAPIGVTPDDNQAWLESLTPEERLESLTPEERKAAGLE